MKCFPKFEPLGLSKSTSVYCFKIINRLQFCITRCRHRNPELWGADAESFNPWRDFSQEELLTQAGSIYHNMYNYIWYVYIYICASNIQNMFRYALPPKRSTFVLPELSSCMKLGLKSRTCRIVIWRTRYLCPTTSPHTHWHTYTNETVYIWICN